MATGALAQNPILQVSDVNGTPLAGALLYSYLSGTSTPTPLYHDAGLTTPWTNPAVADAGGFFLSLYMGAAAQKWVLRDQFGVLQWTVDPVTATAGAAGIGSGTGEVFSFGSNSSAAIANTTYPAGATFDKLSPGTAVFTADSANLIGTFVLQGTGLMVGAGTLSVSLVDLDSGSPDTPIATMTFTSTTGAVAQSGTVTFGAPGIARHYGLKSLVSAATGFLIGATLVKTA